MHPGSGRRFSSEQERTLLVLSQGVWGSRDRRGRAVINGESLHVAGRLLGNRRASTTNPYLHLDDATLGQAAGRVAAAIHLKSGMSD